MKKFHAFRACCGKARRLVGGIGEALAARLAKIA
jgi:hypothetical protein